MIRLAEIKDLDDCVALAIEFFAPFLAKYGVPVIEEDVRNVSIMMIAARQALVVEHDGRVQGACAWAVVPHPANSKLKIFYETIWCVKSKYKTDTLLLLRALQREANKSGADLILMANLNDENEEQVRRILLKKGYGFLETHYSKKLKGE